MFRHRFRYLFVFLLSLYTYLSTELCRVYYYFRINIEWYLAFATILTITFAIWESNRITEPVLKSYISHLTDTLRGLVIFFIVGSVLTTLLTTGIVLLVGMGIKNHSLEDTIEPLKLNLIYAWLANLLFHLVNVIVFYIKEYKIKMEEANNLRQMSVQAELQVVKNQLNPHFLFNNLNVLSSLILQNNNEANRFIEEFSKVYRYILNYHDKELVELDKELHFIDPYIFLLQKRFSEGLHVEILINDQQRNALIVPASLQLLIENAIKHNIISRQKPLFISVHTNGNNTLVVSNNLQPKKSIETSTGIGLQNIIKRYKLVSNKEVIVQNNTGQFSVALPLINKN